MSKPKVIRFQNEWYEVRPRRPSASWEVCLDSDGTECAFFRQRCGNPKYPKCSYPTCVVFIKVEKMLEVQKFLLQYPSETRFAKLTEELGIKARIYEEERVVLLDYDQIESPKMHPIVVECRSLILDLHTLGVVSRKFDRFFNYGECPEFYHDFDFSRATIYEKADGSLIGIWKHQGRWQISTRGMAFAEGEHMLGGTFRDRVLDAFGFKDMNELSSTFDLVAGNAKVTFIFEFTSPENRIVTKYEKPEMVLLGIRSADSEFTELGCEFVAYDLATRGYSVRMPRTYQAEDIDSLVKMANELKNLEEGFVVHDPDSGKRTKIKSKTYVAAHKLRGNDPVPTRKNLLAVILEGEIAELLAVFPEFKQYADPIIEEVQAFEKQLEEGFNQFKDIEEQKEFALAIRHLGSMTKVLFEARKRKECALHTFHSMDLKTKIKMIGE